MVAVVMIAGALVEFAAWWAVSRRGISIWVVMGIALPAMGVAAAAVGEPSISPSVNGGAATAAGAAAGLVLYLATRVFVAAVRPWRTFQRHSVELALASILSHAIWTALILGFPVVRIPVGGRA